MLHFRQRMFGTVQKLARLAPVAARSQLRSNFSTSALRAGDAWSYRTTPPPSSDKFNKMSTAIMTFTWWWIFYGESGLSVNNASLIL